MSTPRPFELGAFTVGEITDDPATGRPLDASTRLREFIELARVADQAGLDVFGDGEHHRPDFAIASPAVVLAAHDRFLAQLGLGGLPFADTAAAAELLASDVLPVVRRATARRPANAH